MAKRKATASELIERILKAAQEHGENDEPDMQIGDLEGLVRLLAAEIEPAKLHKTLARFRATDGAAMEFDFLDNNQEGEA